jgi:hypothetical protein
MPNKCSDSNCSNYNTRKYSDSNTTTQRIWMLDYFNVMIMCGNISLQLKTALSRASTQAVHLTSALPTRAATTLRNEANFTWLCRESTDRSTNQKTWRRNCAKEQGDVPRPVKPFLCFTTTLVSVTDTLNYNRACAYASECAATVEDDMHKLWTIAQETKCLYEGA